MAWPYRTRKAMTYMISLIEQRRLWHIWWARV